MAPLRWLCALLLVGCTSEGGPPRQRAPFFGGTLIATADGERAIVSDTDRDRVVAITVSDARVVSEVALSAGDQPGSLVEDGTGRIHVVLRGAGALATLSSTLGSPLRRDVCAEPRGVAWQADGDLIHVVCTGGELVTLPASGGAPVRVLRLDRDLRDVIVDGDRLLISRMKTAELLVVDADGVVVARELPPTVERAVVSPDGTVMTTATPAVAWRSVKIPGGVVMSHQRALHAPLSTAEGGYQRSGCTAAPVESSATVFRPGMPPVTTRPLGAALPIDLAVAPNGTIAVLTAGDLTVKLYDPSLLTEPDADPCTASEPLPELARLTDPSPSPPTAIAFSPDGALLILYSAVPRIAIHREPGHAPPVTVDLSGASTHDVGRAIFHRQTFSGLACASCHPEGREDGMVWEFLEFGPRRTQLIAGDILDRAPYHWGGDMDSFETLLEEVFVHRMGGIGPLLGPNDLSAVAPWLATLEAPKTSRAGDPEAIARGERLFESQGCTTCHNGSLFTNNRMFDVGTGGPIKVPSLLGVWSRAPFMHTGCAPTLRDRFSSECGGGDKHGSTSLLGAAEVDDLVQYLETL